MVKLEGKQRAFRARLLQMSGWAVVVIQISILSCALLAQTMESRPIKLDIQFPDKSLQVGDQAEITVVCLGADNQPAAAPKDYPVQLLARHESGKVDTFTVTIKEGQSSENLKVPLNESGIVELQVRHDRLQDGGKAIMVKSLEAVPRGPKPTPPTPGEKPRSRGPSVSALQARPRLTLRYSPQRRMLADGKDQANVQAFLLNAEDSIAQDIRIQFFNSSGSFAPQLLTIPAGQAIGVATLTSNAVETVKVELVSSAPLAEVDGSRELLIPFGPPITGVVLTASPPIITLVDKSDVIIQLTDANGQPQNTDQPRQLSLSIDAGRGELEAEELTIPAGGFQVRTTLRPTWRGIVSISAFTPNLPAGNVKITVTLPVLLLSLSVIGGLAGGLIAFWREQQPKWWRIAIGLITGFILYWALVFGVLPVIPREVVLNPLSVFAITVIGGWLGTEVFTIVLRRLGLVN